MADLTLYNRPYEIVKEQIDDMSDRADRALSTAFQTINDLSELDTNIGNSVYIPQLEIPELEMAALDKPDKPEAGKFGAINPMQKPSLSIDYGNTNIDPEAAPQFSPSAVDINLPAAPNPIDLSGAPVKPALQAITMPNQPSLNMPSMADLTQIQIPDFTFPVLPTFNDEAPEFEGGIPETTINWVEPTYSSSTLEEVRTRVSAMLQGGTGIPPAVEQALFDRAIERENQLTHRAVDEAHQTFASRGFDMPPGMLAKQVNAALEENRFKTSTLAREIMAKCAEWEIENLRVAVERGIAMESMLIDQFNNMAQRSFDLQKLRLDADVQVFNSRVSLFNARQTAYQVAADVYKTKLEGELASIEVFKALIEGEKAKGEINEQHVKVYTARVQAVGQAVEIYKAQMQAAQIQSDTNKNLIEGYRVDIQAYAERINARKVEFDAYEARIRGEAAKVGILDAEARAFAATVQAYESKNNVKISSVRAKTEVINSKVAVFTAELQAERDRVQADLGNIQALTSAYAADVQRFSAEMNAASTERQAATQLQELRLRNNLAYYESQLKAYDATIQRLIQQATLQSDAIKSAGQMASQLAAGAMAATNVSASLSGSAGVSSSDSISRNYNISVENGIA